MASAVGIPGKEFHGGSGANGSSPTSFDIPANELEAARPQVSKLVMSLTRFYSSNIIWIS